MSVSRIEEVRHFQAFTLAGLCLAAWVFHACNGIVCRADGKPCAAASQDRADASESPPRMEETPRSTRPNVLLIGIETLRADHVGCLGYRRNTTPALDRLAREGVLCTRAMSTSGWTLPSVMSVMTSLYPDVHRVQTYQDKLSGGFMTLAEVLKARGYATFGVISNPTIEGKYGFSDGFDLYDDFTVSLDFGMDIFQNNDGVVGDQHLSRSSELMTRVAVKWLRERPAGPFFMFAFYFDPHYDYIPPAPFDTLFDPNYEGQIDGRGIRNEPRHSTRPPDRDLQHLLALYDGEIRYTDNHVGALLHALVESGVSDDTLVVLFGDHGDEFYEHGQTAHARTLYNEIEHVPMVLRWPDRLPAGRRIDAITSLTDIMPTILDYLGLRHKRPMQGISLRPMIEGTAERPRDSVWAELAMDNHIQAVIGNHHKLLRNAGNDTWELYHLPGDPGEQVDLYDRPSAKDIRRTLTAQWERWTRDNEALGAHLAQGGEAERIQLNEQQLQKLKALGYVQ